MRSFNEVKFEEPGYPIIKAFVVPYRDGGNIVSTRRVTEKDIEVWREVLSELKKFISESLEFAREVRNLSQTEELELTSDLIALFFKIPLIREPLPATAPNPLKGYLLYRLLYFQGVEDKITKPTELVELIYSREITKSLNELKPVAVLSDVGLAEKIEHCWFVLPSDTRPSLNIAGLIPHLLLTSALVWAKATVEGFFRKEAAIMRLTAMLHDIGKPFRYADHVTASVEVAEILLEGTSYVDEIKEFILKHHVRKAETEEAKILSEMDSIASSIDRLVELSKKTIGDRIREISAEVRLDSNDAYSIGPKGWVFWRKIYQHDESSIENLSKEFVEKIIQKMENYIKPIEDTKGESVKNIEIGLIDVGEIQSFVFSSEELRTVTAASLTIDTLVMAQMPLLIQRHLRNKDIWFPYEAILYSGGGVLELVLPSNLTNLIEEVCKKVEEIRVRYASVPLSTKYGEVHRNLANKIQEKKFQIELEKRAFEINTGKGVRNLCELCYLNPPLRKIKTPEGEKNVCDKCGKLYEIGFNLHFRAKYESEITIGKGKKRFAPLCIFDMNWEGEADKWVIEIISGHEKKELKEAIRLRNLGVVKVDGNLMGPFMGTCLSPSDAYERSARIDLALKKAIEYAVEALFEGVLSVSKNEEDADKAAASVKLGILYAGGDDGLFFMPSWCILPFAIILGREFSSNLGNARGLAIGGVASPARSNVWAMIAAASMLMEKAKAEARRSPSSNLLCFDVVESGTLSDSSAESRLESLRDQFLSSQPYGVEDLFKIVINGYSSDSEAFGKCYVLSRFPELCNDELKRRVEDDQKRVKQIRSAINSSLSAARSRVESSEYIPIAAFFYAKRQEARMGEHSPYREVLKLIPLKLGEKSRLTDADRLIKIVGGGVL
ncbi:MAG: HD domain-containing protein [Thermoproteota archaeon]